MQLKWSQLDSLFCGYSPAALASILLCWLAIAVSATEALAQTQSERPVISQQVRYPHSNGYQLGDKFTHVLQIEMRRPYTLVEDSLPSVGRVSGHIELQRVGVDKQSKLGSRVYTIDLQYQVINYDDGLVGTSVPPAIVSFATETDVYPVVIEPWGLTLSPFLMKETRNHGDMPKLEMLADQTRIPLLGKVLSCVLLALAGIGLLMPSILVCRCHAPIRVECRF